MTVPKKPVACPRCGGERWVGEDPCPICNLAEPPALPPDFIRDDDADAALQAAAEANGLFGGEDDDSEASDDAAIEEALARLSKLQ